LVPYVVIAALFAACSDDGSQCDAWRVAAKHFAECDALAYPPVEDDDDVACVTDLAFRERLPDSAVVSDLVSLDDCTAYLEERAGTTCEPGRSRQDSLDRVARCTYQVVDAWQAPTGGDGCERWKAASAYFSHCDPAVFGVPTSSAKCVDDSEVAALTGGRFDTVGQCADYVFSNAFPCAVQLADREVCNDMLKVD
jgi:hypothetical protein